MKSIAVHDIVLLRSLFGNVFNTRWMQNCNYCTAHPKVLSNYQTNKDVQSHRFYYYRVMADVQICESASELCSIHATITYMYSVCIVHFLAHAVGHFGRSLVHLNLSVY